MIEPKMFSLFSYEVCESNGTYKNIVFSYKYFQFYKYILKSVKRYINIFLPLTFSKYRNITFL